MSFLVDVNSIIEWLIFELSLHPLQFREGYVDRRNIREWSVVSHRMSQMSCVWCSADGQIIWMGWICLVVALNAVKSIFPRLLAHMLWCTGQRLFLRNGIVSVKLFKSTELPEIIRLAIKNRFQFIKRIPEPNDFQDIWFR